MLLSRLKNCLPANAFEVLVVDLPKSLKLVEIDTVLQASDFLIMKGTSEVKVFPLTGFEVYDDARAVNDQAGAVIVLVGHSGGQPPHRPLVQTYALLPDSIVDETSTTVPSIAGEGTAKFDKTSNDINVELSVSSIAQAEKISTTMPIAPDKAIHVKLQWKEKDARFVPNVEIPQDQSAALILLANAMKHPEYAPFVSAAFGPQAAKMLKENQSIDLQDLSIIKRDEKKKLALYTISSAKKKLDFELKKDGNTWQIANYASSAGVPTTTNTGSTGTAQPQENKAAAANRQPEQVSTEQSKNQNANNLSQLPGGLVPERAASNSSKNPVLSLVPGSTQGNDKNKSSSWLEDEQNTQESKSGKPPVAVLPPGLKNEKNDEKEKKNKEKKEREKTEKAREEKAREEKAREEKAREEKAKGEAARTAARVHGAGSVRLRSGPGLNKNAIDEIPAGAKIQVLGEKKGWLKVSFGGKVGYVFSPLVDRGGGDSTSAAPTSTNNESSSKSHHEAAIPATAQPPSTGSGAVVRRPMTVRDENRRAISSVQPGQHVVVLSGVNKNGRYKIRMPDGTVGYVMKDALDVKVETPPEFVP
jgi:uncharacterized protein YraI